jgi:hypothetical protein
VQEWRLRLERAAGPFQIRSHVNASEEITSFPHRTKTVNAHLVNIGGSDDEISIMPTQTGSSTKLMVDANILIAGLNATLGSGSAASDGCPLKLPSDAPLSISAFPHPHFHQSWGIGR